MPRKKKVVPVAIDEQAGEQTRIFVEATVAEPQAELTVLPPTAEDIADPVLEFDLNHPKLVALLAGGKKYPLMMWVVGDANQGYLYMIRHYNEIIRSDAPVEHDDYLSRWKNLSRDNSMAILYVNHFCVESPVSHERARKRRYSS